jgi:DNA/RNA endonuclease YhcR with UshA esterase domain
LGGVAAVAVIAGLLLIFGVSFHHPVTQGSALYNIANEVLVTGTVIDNKEFACPVSEGEMGSHVILQTGNGEVTIHLAPGRVTRSQQLRFKPGETIAVLGSKTRVTGNNDLIAREVMRGTETIILRDRDGKLLLTQ